MGTAKTGRSDRRRVHGDTLPHFEEQIAQLRRKAGDFDGSTQMFAAASHHTKDSYRLKQFAEEIADPNIAALRATKQNRNVFTTKELAGAIAFASVLSYPMVADQLPALLATALA